MEPTSKGSAKRRKRLHVRPLVCAMTILTTIAGLSATSALPSQTRTGLDGPGTLTMVPVTVPAKVSRVAVVPGTDGREAWAIGQMTAAHDEWSKTIDQVVFLHYSGGRWRVYGPPRDLSGNLVKDVRLGGLDFVSPNEGWAVGAAGALVKFSEGQWTYINACAAGQPMSNACGDLFRVSLAKQGSNTLGFAVGASRSLAGTGARLPTILRLDPASNNWRVDDAVAPAEDFAAVTTINAQSAWTVASTNSQELRIYRRNPSAWERVPTGKRMFDFPAPSQDGRNINLAALGQAIDSTPDGNTVWVGGGMYPVNPGSPLEPSHMPFMLRWRSGTFTAFCPRQYALQDDRIALSDVCDPGKTVPISPLDISSVSVVGDGDGHEVFAGGYGLFHFEGGVNGSWSRAHDAVSYLSSVSFASAQEGWVANSGRAVGGGGIGVSDSMLMGHYTASSGGSKKAAIWPSYTRAPMLSVDVSSDGRALAVGEFGASMMYVPGTGWDLAGQGTSRHLRAVEWASGSVAYAVGDEGAIARFDGRGWKSVDDGAAAGRRHLYGIAFSSPTSGYAVGDRGVILRFESGRWSPDPQSGAFNARLHDVAAAEDGFVAVGEQSTVLVNPSGAPGGWSLDPGVSPLFKGLNPAKFYTVEGLSDGTVVVAGHGGLIGRDPAGSFRRIAPFDSSGAFIDIDLRRTGSALQILASVSPDKERFLTRRSTLMYFDGTDWEDLFESSYRSTFIDTDLAGHPDPAFGVAFDPSGSSGWGVGGTLSKAIGDYDFYLEDTTSSIFRIDLSGNAAPKQTNSSDLFSSPPKSGFTFAYFSDSSCGVGPCSLTVGSGTRADRVAIRIRDEINEAAQKPNGPKFVIFGGNMRYRGMPEEVEQFEQFLRGFKIPVYGAMGPQDLLTTDTTEAVERFIPEPPPQIVNAVNPPQDLSTATNSFYLSTFRNMPAPWGTSGSMPAGFRLVPDPPGTAEVRSGAARTFYAFDYAPAGRALARFAFLDTSDRFFSKPNPSNQNPPSNQATWLPDIMSSATTQIVPIPVIVVANVPTRNPLKTTNQPVLADASAFSFAITSGRASAVLSGFVRGNLVTTITASGLLPVPNFILGGGGAPPLKDDPKRVNDGQFYAWHVINVDTSTATSLISPKATLTVKPQPVLESVALHAVNGVTVPAGNTLQFEATGRTIIGGGPPGDVEQNRNAYMGFPSPAVCLRAGLSGAASFCRYQQALAPEYHFVSENPDIARFVAGANAPRMPLVLNGFLVPDDQGGLLCGLKPGKTFVKIVSGGKQMRMPVTVTAGFGPCIDKPILEPPPNLIAIALPQEPDIEIIEEPARVLFKPPTLSEPLVAVLPPVTAPIPAPAPPASAAGARKEEEEAEFEQQGDEGANQQQFQVLAREDSHHYLYIWMVGLVATMVVSSMVAMVAGYRRRYRTSPYVIRLIE